MCVAAALPLLGAAAGAGGAAVANYGVAATVASIVAGAASGMTAKANIDAADFNEKIAKNNAKALKNEAENTRIAGSVAAQAKTTQSRQATSRAAVEMAGRGLDISSGTPIGLLEQNEQMGAVDSMTILNNAHRRAMGYESQGEDLLANARMKKNTARMAGFTSLLSSFATPAMNGIGKVGASKTPKVPKYQPVTGYNNFA